MPIRAVTDFSTPAPIPRDWVAWAVARLRADARRSADTHLLQLPISPDLGVDVYLKDESTHPTGSLKHRLARSLFLYAICNGDIGPDSTVVEASSGSTAVSEAFFARLLGLPFVAVMVRSTSPRKIALIEREGGRCCFVESAADVYDTARNLADSTGGHYLDQFTNAERATDWRGNNNIAESIFEQLEHEAHPTPTWVVVGAGTGGTSATIGRYLRYRGVAHPASPSSTPTARPSYRRSAGPTTPASDPGSRASGARGSSRPSCRTSWTG